MNTIDEDLRVQIVEEAKFVITREYDLDSKKQSKPFLNTKDKDPNACLDCGGTLLNTIIILLYPGPFIGSQLSECFI